MRGVLTLVLAGLLAAPPAFASPESDRIAELEARLAKLEALLARPAVIAQPNPRTSRASAGARLAMLGYTQPLAAMAMGLPIFGGVRMTRSASGGTPADPIVPADGTQNITGALTTSGRVFGGGGSGGVLGDTGRANVAGYAGNGDTGLGASGSGTSLLAFIVGDVTDGASAVAVRITADNDLTTSGAKIASFGDNAGTSYAEKAYIDKDGGITIASTGTFSSTGAAGSGGTVNGMEVDYVTADFSTTGTTPVNVTGVSFALDANDVYSIECTGRMSGAVTTTAPQPGFDVPASAAIVMACVHNPFAQALQNFSADDGSCAFTGTIGDPGVEFTMRGVVTNSTNAGNAVLRLRSEVADANNVTIEAGTRCTAKRIVDN